MSTMVTITRDAAFCHDWVTQAGPGSWPTWLMRSGWCLCGRGIPQRCRDESHGHVVGLVPASRCTVPPPMSHSRAQYPDRNIALVPLYVGRALLGHVARRGAHVADQTVSDSAHRADEDEGLRMDYEGLAWVGKAAGLWAWARACAMASCSGGACQCKRVWSGPENLELKFGGRWPP